MSSKERPANSIEPRLFGSRRLYRWFNQPPKKAVVNNDLSIDLIKLFAVAKLEAELISDPSNAKATANKQGEPVVID